MTKRNNKTKEVKETKFRKVRIDDLNTYNPLTSNQKKLFSLYDTGTNLVIHGVAGTGKSFSSLYLALEEVLEPSTPFKQLVIFRSAVATRNIGFLKGDEKDKIAVYEAPYQSICEELFNKREAYDALIEQEAIRFCSTSHNRGISLDKSIVYVDEMQNLTFHELDTIITRVGKQSKIIFSGDYEQSDLDAKDKSGIKDFLRILKQMDSFKYVEFGVDDIVRSGLVKEYIIAKKAQTNER